MALRANGALLAIVDHPRGRWILLVAVALMPLLVRKSLA